MLTPYMDVQVSHEAGAGSDQGCIHASLKGGFQPCTDISIAWTY